jgi:hypothetical protein
MYVEDLKVAGEREKMFQKQIFVLVINREIQQVEK